MPKKLTTAVFVLNCGSSSIKFQVIDVKEEKVLMSGLAENVQTDRCVLKWEKGKEKKEKNLAQSEYHDVLEEVAGLVLEDKALKESLIAIGHRVVHGGEAFSRSVKIDDEVLGQIHACSHLAPLHNPVNALGILLMQEKFRGVEQVAVFDTAFHQTLPPYAFMYAIPFQYYEKHEVRRYGFHGTSHRYIALEAAVRLRKKPSEISLISAHLGNGCSVCAIQDGQSVDTSMGLTPLEGLMMGQRSGDLDPGAVAFLAEKLKIDAGEVVTVLNKMSGLLGVSGISEDLRLVKKAADEEAPSPYPGAIAEPAIVPPAPLPTSRPPR